MNDWKSATRPGEFEADVEDFCWHDSFVSEVSAVSPAHASSEGSVANWESPADLRLVIVQTCKPVEALELNLVMAESVAVPMHVELDRPTLQVERDRVSLLLDTNHPPMHGKALRWRRLGSEGAAKDPATEPRYGRAFPPAEDWGHLLEPRRL